MNEHSHDKQKLTAGSMNILLKRSLLGTPSADLTTRYISHLFSRCNYAAAYFYITHITLKLEHLSTTK